MQASYELTCWLVQQPKSAEIATEAVQRTFFTKYTWDIAMWQLTCAFFGAFFHPAIQQMLCETSAELASDAKFTDEVQQYLQDTMTAPFTPSTYVEMLQGNQQATAQ